MRVEFVLIQGTWFKNSTQLPNLITGNRYQKGRARVVLGSRGEIDIFGTAPIMIGRDPSNDIILDTNTISRKHCFIYFEGDNAFVKDVSSYGTVMATYESAKWGGGYSSPEKHIVTIKQNADGLALEHQSYLLFPDGTKIQVFIIPD